MSLKPEPIGPIPQETARVAKELGGVLLPSSL
jgi:hypothetical protein